MVIGKQRHKLLKLILAFLIGGSQQFLDDLEHGYDVPLGRVTELCHQQDCCGQQTFGGIVEVCVLPEGSSIHTGEDNGLGNDLSILFSLCLVHQFLGMLLVQIHILVDQVEKVIAIGAGRVTQINHGDLVAVLLGDGSVVAHDIALGIRGKEGYSAGAGVLDAGVQPVGGLSHTGGANHQDMDISGVHHSGGVSGTAYNDALGQRLAIGGRCLALRRLLPPQGWGEWNVLIGSLDFGSGCPPGCAVLTVTDRFGFDTVEVIDVCDQGDAGQHAKHNRSDND